MSGYFPRVTRGVHSYPVDESVPAEQRLASRFHAGRV